MYQQPKLTFQFELDYPEFGQLFPLQSPKLIHRVDNEEGITDYKACRFLEDYKIADLDNSTILTNPVYETVEKGEASEAFSFVKESQQRFLNHEQSEMSAPQLQTFSQNSGQAESQQNYTANTDELGDLRFQKHIPIIADDSAFDIPNELKITEKDLEWSDDDILNESDSEAPNEWKITAEDLEWSDNEVLVGRYRNDSASKIPEELMITSKDLKWSDHEEQSLPSPVEGPLNRDVAANEITYLSTI